MTEPLPDDGLQLRTWLIAGVLSAVVLLVGVGIAFALMASHSSAGKPPATASVIGSSVPTSLSATDVAGSGSATSSASVNATDSSSTETTGSTTVPTGKIVHAARIAYRHAGQIWVSGEDGSAAKAVLSSTDDEFALSPNGRTLVVSQGGGSTRSALLVDVASGVKAPVRGATDLPVFSADSKWLAYTATSVGGTPTIRRVNADGSGDALLLAEATGPAISPDGKRVAYRVQPVASLVDTQPVRVFDLTSRTKTSVPRSGGAINYAFAPNGALYFVVGGDNGWLGLADKHLAASTLVASLPAEPESSPGQLFVSPDGNRVLFAIAGEDGYHSRLQVANAGARTIRSISSRLDAAPLGWLTDGTGFLDVEGDLAGGGSTAIFRRRVDGSGRSIVIDDAGLGYSL